MSRVKHSLSLKLKEETQKAEAYREMNEKSRRSAENYIDKIKQHRNNN